MGATKCTPEVIDIICEALRVGNYKSTAAQAAGIAPSTLKTWEKKGAEGIEPYATFVEQTDIAEAQGEMALFEVIYENAMTGSWSASAWALERKNPACWGKKDKMELSSDKDFKIEIQGVKSDYKMDDDEKKLLDGE